MAEPELDSLTPVHCSLLQAPSPGTVQLTSLHFFNFTILGSTNLLQTKKDAYTCIYTHTSLRKLHGRQSKENKGLSVNHSTEKLPIPKKERGHGVFHSFPNSKIIPLAVSDWRFRMSHGEEH